MKPSDDETRGNTGRLVQYKQKSSKHVAKVLVLHGGRAVLERTNDQEPEVTRSILGGDEVISRTQYTEDSEEEVDPLQVKEPRTEVAKRKRVSFSTPKGKEVVR